MSMLAYARKAQNGYYWLLDKLSKSIYIKKYPKYLRKLGIKINENPGDCWISPTVFFDSAGYELIEIGDNCTFSFDVVVLVHDYSINNAFRYIKVKQSEFHQMIMRPVSVGNNCFIGARAIILPGAHIGNDCIVGSGAVVRGSIPDGSIVCGNPARVIGDINSFAYRHYQKKDYQEDCR